MDDDDAAAAATAATSRAQMQTSGATTLNDFPPQAQPPPAHAPYPRSKSRAGAPGLCAFRATLTLENSGSVARDHLASERTWLAYARTSLAIAGTGVALVQLFMVSASGTENAQATLRFVRPLGATAVLLALGVLAIGVLRYFRIQKAMTEGQFPAARQTVVFIATVLAALVAVTFGILVTAPRRA